MVTGDISSTNKLAIINVVVVNISASCKPTEVEENNF